MTDIVTTSTDEDVIVRAALERGIPLPYNVVTFGVAADVARTYGITMLPSHGSFVDLSFTEAAVTPTKRCFSRTERSWGRALYGAVADALLADHPHLAGEQPFRETTE